MAYNVGLTPTGTILMGGRGQPAVLMSMGAIKMGDAGF